MAVSPTDVMDALRCGLRVYGASSMGALRAVELAPYGMIGHGSIYEHVLHTPYFRDDYLGQTFTEAPEGQQSEPYINSILHFKKYSKTRLLPRRNIIF